MHSHNFIDRVGHRYGQLTVRQYAGKDTSGLTLWLCICVCNQETVVRGSCLVKGATTSCGCHKRAMSAQLCQSKSFIKSHTKHGHSGNDKTPTYTSWENMIHRCTNPHNVAWKNYGGSNPPVRVCKRWGSFENFLSDVGPRPSIQHSLGRILDRGNYELGNAFWMTRAEQTLNKRNNSALNKWADSRRF